MPATVKVKLDLSKLEALAQSSPELVDQAVAKIAEDGLAQAQTRCPVDTGNLKNSLHVEPPKQLGQRRISDGTEYGIYVELGTTRMAARPFLLPAVLAAVQGLAAAIGHWMFRDAATGRLMGKKK